VPRGLEPGSDRALAEARTYLVTLLLVATLLCAAVFALNLAINPSGMFSTGLLEPIVWIARTDKVRLLENHGQPVEALVLGSSRAMKVEPAEVERLTGLRTFNAAVNSARSEDYLAILRWSLDDLGARLQRVVLGLDVEAFHNAVPVDLRILAVPQLATKLPARSRFQARLASLQRALGLPELKLSIHSIRQAGIVREQDAEFDKAGLLTYRRWDSQLAEGTLDLYRNVSRSKADYNRRFAGFTALDDDRVRHFEDLLELCAERDIALSVYITPVHPEVAAELSQRSGYDRRVAEVRDLLHRLRRQHPFDLLDASDIEAIGGDRELFYDGGHPRVENNRLILAQLLGNRGDDAVQ